MSAFLGPIHQLMYRKILNQEKILRELLKNQPEKLLQLNILHPEIPQGELEEIIDLSNIHGWLSAQIEKVELRQAWVILQTPDVLECMKKIGVEAGRASEQQLASAQDLSRILKPLLLDGMPCEWASMEEMPDEYTLRLYWDSDVHQSFYEEASQELGIQDYPDPADIRTAYLNGLATALQVKFTREEKASWLFSFQ